MPPFHWTLDEEIKLFPLIVNVNAAPPAVVESGLRETTAGTGFSGGGPTPELPDPPPHPHETTTSRKADIAKRRRLEKGTVLRIYLILANLKTTPDSTPQVEHNQREKSPVRINAVCARTSVLGDCLRIAQGGNNPRASVSGGPNRLKRCVAESAGSHIGRRLLTYITSQSRTKPTARITPITFSARAS